MTQKFDVVVIGAGPDGAQFQTDDAGTDHAQLLRHGLEFQGAGGVCLLYTSDAADE